MLERLARRVTRIRWWVARGQERTSDDDDATSEGVFMWKPTNPVDSTAHGEEGTFGQEFWWPTYSQCEHQFLPNLKSASASEGPLQSRWPD